MGQSIYFTTEQLAYMEKLVDSFDSYDAEQEGEFDEARVLREINMKVFQANQRDKVNK